MMGIKAGKVWGGTELIHANGVLEFHRIEFNKGFKCSEHAHEFKWNGFFVESGKMIKVVSLMKPSLVLGILLKLNRVRSTNLKASKME
jgi:hypothetical protein